MLESNLHFYNQFSTKTTLLIGKEQEWKSRFALVLQSTNESDIGPIDVRNWGNALWRVGVDRWKVINGRTFDQWDELILRMLQHVIDPIIWKSLIENIKLT